MMLEMLMLFIILSIILFILILFFMEDTPMIAIPLIMVNMIFIVIITYGFWDVEWFYTAYNSTVGNSTAYLYSTDSYGEPYSYIFFMFFLIHVLLFIRVGWVLWKQALDTPGEMDYYNKNKRR